MTCQTDDPEREAAYLAFVRDIEPKLKPIQNAIREPLPRLAASIGAAAETAISSSTVRSQNRRDLFREANIPRETELAELEQQYQKTDRGHDRHLSRPGAHPGPDGSVSRRDRPRRPRRRRGSSPPTGGSQDREALDDLVRPDEAAPHRDRRTRQDSTTSSSTRSATASGSTTASPTRSGSTKPSSASWCPCAARSRKSTEQSLGVESLRPWDLAVDPLGRPPLCRSTTSRNWPRAPSPIFRDVDPELGEQFAFLRAEQLLDLANRKGKAPGGYQTTLEDERLPFIFMNAVGLDGDVRTLLHEGGHAFHTLACRGEPLSAYRESPLEFCEVASMTHGAPGRPPARPVLQPTPTPTDRTASCSRESC